MGIACCTGIMASMPQNLQMHMDVITVAVEQGHTESGEQGCDGAARHKL